MVGHNGDRDTTHSRKAHLPARCVSASQAPSSFGRISTLDGFKKSTKKRLFLKKKKVLILKKARRKKFFTFKTLFIALIA